MIIVQIVFWIIMIIMIIMKIHVYHDCSGNVFVMAAILLDRHLQSVANYLILRYYHLYPTLFHINYLMLRCHHTYSSFIFLHKNKVKNILHSPQNLHFIPCAQKMIHISLSHYHSTKAQKYYGQNKHVPKVIDFLHHHHHCLKYSLFKLGCSWSPRGYSCHASWCSQRGETHKGW